MLDKLGIWLRNIFQAINIRIAKKDLQQIAEFTSL